MLRIHYYRYDQDYTGWDLWLWEKGKDGSAHMFQYQEAINGETDKIAKVAEIDVSCFKSDQAGIIVRRGGWHDRDLHMDRYFKVDEAARTSVSDVYIIQDTAEIFYSEHELCLTPGLETAVFENFREIHIKLQAPSKVPHEVEPFRVLENGMEVPIRAVTQIRGAREFLISLQEDMTLGSTYMVYKHGFRVGGVSYGMLYDTPEFEKKFTYDKSDLGANWTEKATTFKLWAPTASSCFVNLYEAGSGSHLESVYEMSRGCQGTWMVRVPGDLDGKYYTYTLFVMGLTLEAADPYGRSSGVNGRRSMVMNPAKTHPEGWDKVGYVPLESPTDAVLYEVHVRDATIHPFSGVTHKGLFLGLAEKCTKTPDGQYTGLSHFKELGVTHVHLMPIFDYFTVDETKPLTDQYNWGYDPTNFNVPEGSYATNPYEGHYRVRELKTMIKAFKEEGLGVVMDVVYNHTYKTMDSDFNKIVPGYYYRTDRYGKFSNGSGCGNEMASERSMVRRFIIDSVLYWAKEYKVDGFRFDLMGLMDIETMNEVRSALDSISPSIILYGEGWTGGASLLDSCCSASKTNAPKLDRIGFFNDNTRDAIKGDNFHSQDTGFITGNFRARESVKFGIAGAVYHHEIDYTRVNYNGFAWAGHAWHCVNYVAAHDNLTLYDKLTASRPDLSDEDYQRLVKLAAAMVLTSQGIPFLLSGVELLRSKKGNHNSYSALDEINQIDWSLKGRYRNVFDYHRGLIALRKAHPAFRMVFPEDIRQCLRFLPTSEGMIAYTLSPNANGDSWKTIVVAFNAGTEPETLDLPASGDWHIAVDENRAATGGLGLICGYQVLVAPRSALILYQE